MKFQWMKIASMFFMLRYNFYKGQSVILEKDKSIKQSLKAINLYWSWDGIYFILKKSLYLFSRIGASTKTSTDVSAL